jgi:hypothetical protein
MPYRGTWVHVRTVGGSAGDLILIYSPFKLYFTFKFMLLLLVLLMSESVTTILLLVYQPALLWRIRVYSLYNFKP